MNSEETLRGFNRSYLEECFSIEDWVLYWKERPLSHFKSEKSQKTFNTCFSGKKAGRINNGYLQIHFSKCMLLNHRIIYFLAFKTVPKVVDHIDGNTLNNNPDNLRSVNFSQNGMNCKTSTNNSSGRKGVYFHKSTGKYTASIRIDKKLKHLGIFANISDAENARLLAEKKYYGVYANDR